MYFLYKLKPIFVNTVVHITQNVLKATNLDNKLFEQERFCNDNEFLLMMITFYV